MWQRADATDLIANRSDTFIFEAAKSEEFSDSEILAVSRFKSERAIAYLPFTARGIDVGLDEKTDKIITVSLSLYVKDLPLFTAAQIEEKKIEARKKDRLRHTEKPENPPASSGETREGGESGTLSGAISDPSPLAAAAIAEAAAMAEKGGTEHDEKKIIRISIFGIVDDPAFEPNSKAFRVSWDGKNDAPAPKHDPVDGRIDSVGVFKIGTLELDLGRNTYDDGDKIEFESRELTEFMNFVYGINSAQGLHSDIRSHLGKIENFAIILKQESGERGVIFYSAVSLVVSTYMTDAALEGLNLARLVYIISDSNREICDRIYAELKRGVTGLNSVSMYSGRSGRILMCVIRKGQLSKLKKIIQDIDKDAFVIICDAKEVMGSGFEMRRI